MLLLPKCIVAEYMAMPAVLLCGIYTSPTLRSNNFATFQASHFQARRLLVFHFFVAWRMGKKPAAWACRPA